MRFERMIQWGLPICAIAVTLWLSWAQFQANNGQLEWYSSPDQDISLISDALAMNDGISPIQAIHPGWGQTILMAAYFRLVHGLGISPVASLSDYKAFENPLLIWPQLKAQARLFVWFACLAVGLSLSYLAFALSQNMLAAVLTFITFVPSIGFAVQSMLVRSEPMSAVYGLLGLAFALKARFSLSPSRSLLYIGLSGLMVLLACYCKLHALPFFAMATVLVGFEGSILGLREYQTSPRYSKNLSYLYFALVLIMRVVHLKTWFLIGLVSFIILHAGLRFLRHELWLRLSTRLMAFLIGALSSVVIVCVSLILLMQSRAAFDYWRMLSESVLSLGYAYKTFKTHDTILAAAYDGLAQWYFTYFQNFLAPLLLIAVSCVFALLKRRPRWSWGACFLLIMLMYAVFASIRYSSVVYLIYFDVFLSLALAFAAATLLEATSQAFNFYPRIMVGIAVLALLLTSYYSHAVYKYKMYLTHSDGRWEGYEKEYQAVDPRYDFGRYEVKRYFFCEDGTPQYNQIMKDHFGNLENFYLQLSKVPSAAHF